MVHSARHTMRPLISKQTAYLTHTVLCDILNNALCASCNIPANVTPSAYLHTILTISDILDYCIRPTYTLYVP